jgi:Ulp1 family protease
LNDEVVNCFLRLLQAKQNRRVSRDSNAVPVHVFTTFFWTKLSGGPAGYDFDAVQRWTKRSKVRCLQCTVCASLRFSTGLCNSISRAHDRRADGDQ